MPKTKISEFSSTPANNTDIDSINIAEGCAPSGINDAIRELMAQLKDWQSGTSNDPMVIGSSGSLTLNQGTANGVAYLNGSKVVTSGSGLVFDGTNLGLGVTPSAWSAFKPYQVGWGALASTSATQNTLLSSNVYFDGTNFKYIGTGTASYLQQFDGSFIWKTAASGTAGNAITFTQAMTLTAAGNLGLGTTSPVAISNYVVQTINGTNGSFTEYQQSGSNSFRVGSDSSAGGFISTPAANPIRIITNDVERARIDSSGNLGVGTTSPLARLHGEGTGTQLRLTYSGVASYNFKVLSPNAFTIDQDGTERLRIDSSGNLLVGTTSLDAKIGVVQTANTEGIYVTANNGSYTDNVLRLDCTRNTTNSSYNFLECTVPGVSNRLFIRDSGNVVNANNSYGAISDAKLKENVTDATPKLEKLNQVRVVNFNMKGDMQKQIGVIAQELEQIFPGMVEETPDRDEEGNGLGTTTKSVKYSVFVPMLIKAIQEQQAIIESLKARLDAANL